jgi:hypothetical protein
LPAARKWSGQLLFCVYFASGIETLIVSFIDVRFLSP